MIPRVRSRLLLASAAILVAVGGAGTLLTRRQISHTEQTQARNELLRDARAVAAMAKAAPARFVSPDQAGVAAFTQMAHGFAARVEVIAADGTVLLDSENGRPITGKTDLPSGSVDGESSESDADHVAAFVRAGGEAAPWVRVSRPAGMMAPSFNGFYWILTLAAGTGIIVALLMSYLASALINRSIRAMMEDAKHVVRGDARRVAVSPGDALADLGGWFNFMAEDAERAVTALTRERARLTSVLEGMGQGVIALDNERRIAVMNDAARRLLGLSSTPVGEVLVDVVRVPELVALVELPGGGVDEFQLDAERRVVARAAVPPDGDGRMLILEDVTAVRRLETIRRDFVANVSHELRTPVSIVRANAETLLTAAKHDPEMGAKLIDGIHRNAERLARILTDLLDLSRLDAGHYRLETADVDVARIADAAIAAVLTAAEERNVVISAAIAPGVRARADGKALDQILVNLIDNAVKYTTVGGNVQIVAIEDTAAHRVRIEVRDDGPGIAAKHRDRVFERFYRIDAGRSREAGGTGLGLAIVKHLVESMSGEVGVGANSPRGTVFWIDLPVT